MRWDAREQHGADRIVPHYARGERFGWHTADCGADGQRGAEEKRARISSLLAETAAALRVPPSEVPQRVAALAKEVRELKKHAAAGPKGGDLSPEKLIEQAAKVGGASVIVAEAAGAEAGLMRELIDLIRRKVSPAAVMLASRAEDKVTIVAGLTRDLVDKGLSAGEWIKSAAEAVGGRGGGKPDMAQAGGKHPDQLPAALSGGARQY